MMMHRIYSYASNFKKEKEDYIMAFIHKENFSIVGYVEDYLIKDEYFECDDLIAPAISLLNKKGYKTTFCCSGHPYATLDSALIVNKECIEDCEWLRIEDSDSDIIREIYEHDVTEYPYYVVVRCNECEVMYVYFDKSYKFPELPEGMYIDENGLYWKCDMEPSEGFETIERIFNMNKIFYEWVKKLPDLNGE